MLSEEKIPDEIWGTRMIAKNAESGDSTGVAANKELVARWFDAMERGAWDEATSLWAPDAVNHYSGRHGPRRGREALSGVFHVLRNAFPDRRWQIDDLIAEDDRVVCRMTISGTFGTFPGPPQGPLPAGWVGVESTALVPRSATGKPYSVKHIHVFRIADGLIAEHWAARDDLSLLLQLGAIEPPTYP